MAWFMLFCEGKFSIFYFIIFLGVVDVVHSKSSCCKRVSVGLSNEFEFQTFNVAKSIMHEVLKFLLIY